MEKLLVNKQLYPFQRDAIIELNNFYQNEKNPKGYLHIATGGGKTLVSNYFLVKKMVYIHHH
jgi:superfamily II DNA or RNA helicase